MYFKILGISGRIKGMYILHRICDHTRTYLWEYVHLGVDKTPPIYRGEIVQYAVRPSILHITI